MPFNSFGLDNLTLTLWHTLISKLVNKGAQHHLIKRIVGHSIKDDVTLSVYSNPDNIPLKLLKETMDDNLDWHDYKDG